MSSTASKDAPTGVPLGKLPSFPVSSKFFGGISTARNPRDLPSFPSVGLPKDHAAASAAASLGWANQKPVEPWRPDDNTASASAAAALANRDSRSMPAWEPERSEAGPKAAIMAAGSAQKQRIPQSSSPTGWGNSAANIAFKTSKPTATAAQTGNAQPLARMGSMKAAKGAMASARPRAFSSPQTIKETYPDQANAATNALRAATSAHKPNPRISAGEAGAVPYVKMNRQMFTSAPPVKPEVDEQRRNEVLHASAVAMAKRMYTQQQKSINATRNAHQRSSSFNRHGEGTDAGSDETERPMAFGNLQEAAYRLAQERLAKLHDEHQANREMQDYYGASAASPQRNKFGSVRARLTRRRASSEGEVMHDDEAQSRQIRKQMSLFNNKLTQVDQSKRAKDREALLAAAQRNVKAQLDGMDQKMFEDTGRMAPGKRSEWEHKAQTAAQTRVDSTRSPNADKLNIGGGMFMAQEDVEKIAAKRVQPLLDEINQHAEEERERQAALRLEHEKKKEDEEKKKMREREIQDIHKKLKDQQKDEEKLRKAEAKEEERARKEEEKAAKRQAKEEKSKAHQEPELSAKAAGKQPETALADDQPSTSPTKHGVLSLPKLPLKSRDKDEDEAVLAAERSPVSDGDPSSPSSRMKNWLKSRFTRPRAKSTNNATDETAQGKGFIGGVALTKLRGDHNASMSSLDQHSASIREVAMAGRGSSSVAHDDEPAERTTRGRLGFPKARTEDDAVSVSSLSSEEEFAEARSDLSGRISPPRPIHDPASGRGSPVRESRFSEQLE